MYGTYFKRKKLSRYEGKFQQNRGYIRNSAIVEFYINSWGYKTHVW